MVSSTGKSCTPYPIVRSTPLFTEESKNDIFDRPRANVNSMVLVSKNHSLILGIVSKLFAKKSKIPDASSSWQYEISDGVGVQVEDIDSKKTEIVRAIYNVVSDNDLFQLFNKGDIVLEMSVETDTRIGVVLENASLFNQIKVKAVSKLDENGSVLFVESEFDRTKAYLVSFFLYIPSQCSCE